MSILLWAIGIILGIVVLLIGGFILLAIRAAKVTARRDQMLDEKIAPALETLQDGATPNHPLILELAESPLTRNRLLAALAERGRADLFPERFRSLPMIAESDLAKWLAHGNELGSAPSQIELAHHQQINAEGRTGTVFLFRFRVDPPHWASDRGWMAGVSGPFWDDEPDQFSGQATFSELGSYSGKTDSEHLGFLAHAATRFGWVVPTPTISG